MKIRRCQTFARPATFLAWDGVKLRLPAAFKTNPIPVSFPLGASRGVLNKILEPRNAVTISVYYMLIPLDLNANSPAFL